MIMSIAADKIRQLFQESREKGKAVMFRYATSEEVPFMKWEKAAQGIDYVKICTFKDDLTYLIKMEAGTEFPPHYHDTEEMNFVIKGKLKDKMLGRVVSPGQSYRIGKEVPHHIVAVEDTTFTTTLKKPL